MRLCDYGCGQVAKFQFKNGKFCCENNISKCPTIQNKNSISKKGIKRKPLDENTKLKISIANKGIKRSKETCEKLSIIAKNRDSSLINKMAMLNKGSKHSLETKLKMSESHKKMTEETKLKISLGMKGHVVSNETRLKISNTKKQMSDNCRKKISDGLIMALNDYKIKHPHLFLIEELKEDIDGNIISRCKNSNCKNSKENDGWFIVSKLQLTLRLQSINNGNGNCSYFYCCEECKHECILFGKSASQLQNIIMKYDSKKYYTQTEYNIWKHEVFNRQLIDNPNHLENFCEKCHSIENLHCHHIIPQKINNTFSLDPDNGIVLCQKCHFEIGHEKGTECSTGNLANNLNC